MHIACATDRLGPPAWSRIWSQKPQNRRVTSGERRPSAMMLTRSWPGLADMERQVTMTLTPEFECAIATGRRLAACVPRGLAGRRCLECWSRHVKSSQATPSKTPPVRAGGHKTGHRMHGTWRLPAVAPGRGLGVWPAKTGSKGGRRSVTVALVGVFKSHLHRQPTPKLSAPLAPRGATGADKST